MNHPRVFVVHQPTGRDPATGEVVPTMDLLPAADHGEVVHLLHHAENPFRDLTDTARRVLDRLVEEGYDGRRDFLLLVGNPALIGVVAAAAAMVSPWMRMLQWDRVLKAYDPTSEVDLTRAMLPKDRLLGQGESSEVNALPSAERLAEG